MVKKKQLQLQLKLCYLMENNMLKDGRIIQELPKTFYNAKREFEKTFTFQTSKAKNEDKKEELNNYSVLFGLIQEYNAFLLKYEEQITVHIKDLMDEENTHKILLGEYGKKLTWDDEAKWMYFEDMNKNDWNEFDKICNEKYLNK